MSDLKALILCADDFALDRAVDAAVLDLAGAGRLSAVSCFTDAPHWTEAGVELATHAGRLLIGLHFNLTEELGHGEPPLRHWIRRSVLGALDPEPVRAALRRQLRKFEAVIGREPDYIDGHQHVHAFPVIRDAVRQVAAESREGAGLPLRDVSKPVGATDAPLKRYAIRRLARLRARRDAWPALNATFAGDYSLSASAPFAALFETWVRASSDGGLIMCHPRRPRRDSRASAGSREYAFLASGRLEEALAAHGCRLLRGRAELQADVGARSAAMRLG